MIPNQVRAPQANDALFDNLIPLNSSAAPDRPLICIGQNLSLKSKSGQINLAGLFVSPAGQIVIILSNHPSDQELSSIITELRSWDCERLDEIASEHTYQSRGQAFRIIDMMAERGHLTFSDGGELTKAINQNMRSGSFNLFCAGDPAI